MSTTKKPVDISWRLNISPEALVESENDFKKYIGNEKLNAEDYNSRWKYFYEKNKAKYNSKESPKEEEEEDNLSGLEKAMQGTQQNIVNASNSGKSNNIAYVETKEDKEKKQQQLKKIDNAKTKSEQAQVQAEAKKEVKDSNKKIADNQANKKSNTQSNTQSNSSTSKVNTATTKTDSNVRNNNESSPSPIIRDNLSKEQTAFLNGISRVKDENGKSIFNIGEDGTIGVKEPMTYKEWSSLNGARKRSVVAGLLNVAQVAGAFAGIPPIADGKKIVSSITGMDDKQAYETYRNTMNTARDNFMKEFSTGAGKQMSAGIERDVSKEAGADTLYLNSKLTQAEWDGKSNLEKEKYIKQYENELQKEILSIQNKYAKELAVLAQTLANKSETEKLSYLEQWNQSNPGAAEEIGKLRADLDSKNVITSKDLLGAASGVLGTGLGTLLGSDKRIKSFILPKIWR